METLLCATEIDDVPAKQLAENISSYATSGRGDHRPSGRLPWGGDRSHSER